MIDSMMRYCGTCRTSYTEHRLEHDHRHHSSGVPTQPMPADMPRRPRGATPLRNVRVPDELWQAALAKAEVDDTTVSEQIVAFLRTWTGSAANG